MLYPTELRGHFTEVYQQNVIDVRACVQRSFLPHVFARAYKFSDHSQAEIHMYARPMDSQAVVFRA